MYKVLIADDEKIIRIALKSMISWEDLGFSAVYAAEDGLSALQIVKEHCPDLVIIDIMMPGMNGIDFVKQARQDGYTGEIVILSNHQNFNYAVEALRNRVSDYILKTDITPQSLTQCLLKVKKKLDASAPAMEQAPEAAPEADADRDIALLQDALKQCIYEKEPDRRYGGEQYGCQRAEKSYLRTPARLWISDPGALRRFAPDPPSAQGRKQPDLRS